MNLNRRNFLRLSGTAILATNGVLSACAQEQTEQHGNAPGPAITWVKNGKPLATIVTADKPFPIAEYAARELAYHIKLSTGASLPVIAESKAASITTPKIWIGQTNAARSKVLSGGELEPEACILRAIGEDFYIVGNEGPENALDLNTVHSGTLWGVYEILERTLNARWLWPGAGGEAVAPMQDLQVPGWDEIIKPHLISRMIRTYVPWNNGKPVIYSGIKMGQDSGMAYSSLEVLNSYLRDQQVFLRRHRMGMSQNPNYTPGHDFVGWWKEYGEQHPEWFQLIPVAKGEFAGKPQQDRAHLAHGRPQNTWEGKRGPDNPKAPYLVSMCVSNRELHQEIINRWQKEREKHPGKDIPIKIGENDIWALCVCDNCLALDAPQPSPEEIAALPGSAPGQYYPFDAGRRYAWFYQQVHRLASKIDPNVKVCGYIYLNYFAAPADIELHPNIILSFVPWGGWYYPRDPRAEQWLQQQWKAWRKLGASIIERPNFVLDGGSMPFNYAHQMTSQFDFYLRHGCIGTDFDARPAQWSAQGATMYALLTKHRYPEKSTEELLEDYYSAFGPAAEYIKVYFDFWETHATANAVLAADAMTKNNATNLLTYARAAHDLFPEASFDHAEQFLQAAQKAVAGNSPLEKRVEYIQFGLTHARKVRAVSAIFADKNATRGQYHAALQDLLAFRHATENLDIANYAQSAADEVRSFSDRYDFKTKDTTVVMPAD
jgi:hypothetical protein